jgi:enamine deaminase RidA (YjgF/YER057c/UK114 family)
VGIISDRLKELGIELPLPGAPSALYLPAVTVNNLVYTSGNDSRFDGKLGKDLTVEQGQQAARHFGFTF